MLLKELKKDIMADQDRKEDERLKENKAKSNVVEDEELDSLLDGMKEQKLWIQFINHLRFCTICC